MPVLVDIDAYDHHLLSRAPSGSAAAKASLGSRAECLDIGLINNMPDAALMSTERQLFDLIDAAAGRLVVRLHFYTMETTPRSEWGHDYVRRYYRSTDDLVISSLDGIIVTGAEPRAARLTEEPYWTTLVQVMDWATENTISSLYSCLAVHAAVLHMDSVERHALPAKCIGVFTHAKTTDHPLMHEVPATFRIPHARWNEVQEEAIAGCGYSVLTKSAEAGSTASSSSRRRAFSSISRAIRNTIPRACWANTEGTWAGSSGERTKSVRRYREVILARRRKRYSPPSSEKPFRTDVRSFSPISRSITWRGI